LSLRQQDRPDEAAFEFETVLASNRNPAGALLQLGVCKAMTGSLDEAISLRSKPSASAPTILD
jgi:hypothetical protein